MGDWSFSGRNAPVTMDKNSCATMSSRYLGHMMDGQLTSPQKIKDGMVSLRDGEPAGLLDKREQIKGSIRMNSK